MELDFGEWEGLNYAEAAERWPAEMAAWLKDSVAAPPAGESVAAAARRILPALARVLGQPPATVVVVSHVTPMKIVLRHALLAPPPAVRRMHLDVACLCEIDWHDEGLGVVRTFNDTAHLQPRDWPATTSASTGGR
jgi:probable phosphoglycerate mutase